MVRCRRNWRELNLMPVILAAMLVAGSLGLAQAAVTHGPLVGGVTHESARMLVRTDAAGAVQFEVDTDNGFGNPILSTTVTAVADSDYFVICDVAGLAADTKYYYRALIDGTPEADERSFYTFPHPGMVSDFTFAFGGCQQAAHDPDSYIGRVWPLIAAEEPRFFLQLGDWTYPDTTDTPADSANFFATDYGRVQATYRSKYDPTYPMDELLRVSAVDYVYDDHDYTNDNSDMTYAGRENSVRGYSAMFPHYPLANEGNGLWHKFSFGNADFFIIDTRTQRDPNLAAFSVDGTGKYKFTPSSDHLILQADPGISGELQLDWLIRELKESTATWKFVGTGVPFNPGIRAAIDLALLLQGVIPGVEIGEGFFTPAEIAIQQADMWCGFPASAARLVKEVHEAGVENVIMLSADSHNAGMDDGAHSLFPEFMAGGLDRNNFRIIAAMEDFFLHPWNAGAQTQARNNFNSHYGRVTVFGDDSVRCDLVDEYGELIASYTQPAGHLVSSVALAIAPEGQAFDSTKVGGADLLPILFTNTGADTVQVTSIESSNPAFSVSPFQKKFSLPPGLSTPVPIFFRPQEAGVIQAALTIESNDPESPFIAPLVGIGYEEASSVGDPETATPWRYALEQNYPNPFNAGTQITYELAASSDVTLHIYNLAGQEVRNFQFRKQKAGRYHVGWDGRSDAGTRVASGVYIYRIKASSRNGEETFVESRKLMYLQ